MLAAVSVLSLFSGCQDISTQTGAGNVTLELDKNLLPDMDIENKTVKCYYAGAQSNVDKDLNLTAALSVLKEKYGVEAEFEFVQAQQYTTRLTALIAGGNIPDLAFGRDAANYTFIKNKLVQPLGEYFDYDSELWKDMKRYEKSDTWNGAALTMPLTYSVDGTFVYSNKKMFDEAGLDYPSMYAERGEWNWDTMLELAQQLTVLGSDGQPTVYGYNDPTAFSLLSSAGIDLITQDENGKFINNLENQTLADTMNFYYELGPRRYNVILLDKRPDVSLPAGSAAMGCGNHTCLQFFTDMFDYLDVAPIPSNPNSNTKYVYGKVLRSPFICAGAENIDGAVAFINCQRLVEKAGATKENKIAVIKAYNRLSSSEEINAIVESMATMYDEGYEYIEPRATTTLYSGVGDFWSWAKNPAQPWSSFVASWKNVLQPKVEQLNEDCAALK